MSPQNGCFLRPMARLLMIALSLFALAGQASAEWKEKVLYSFQGGSDGQTPAGGVVFDKAGNLYGVTNEGGSTCPSPGCGTVFQLAPPTKKGGSWSETIVYGFNGTDGSIPVGGAIIDGNGNLYGTTAYGGSGTCLLFGDNVGCGVVYELSPPTKKGGQWTYTVLYNFQGGKDGLFPWGDLVFDSHGNLYGATQFGGGKGTTCNQYFDGNCGTVFELSPPKQKGGKWTEKILHSFAGVSNGQQVGDGADPNGALILDNDGAIYGTTHFGGSVKGECSEGSGGTGCGVVFKLAPRTKKSEQWSETILRRFDGPDGGQSVAGVIFDHVGNLYGTTVFGGNNGGGVVFNLKPPSGRSHVWTETVLYKFTDSNDGANPMAGLIFDADGNLYGSAYRGGSGSVYGDVFELKPPEGNRRTWTFSLLYGFGNGTDGWAPAASLALDEAGGLYGTTQAGGVGTGCNNGCGTVLEVSP